MTNSVLCAIDVSNEAGDSAALKTAARLAALDGAQLDVIAVVPDYGLSQVGSFFSKDHHDKMVEDANKKLHEIVTNTLGKDQDDMVRHVVATGRVYEEVLSLAEKTNPSLIVVGARKTDLKDYLLGPNAARVVRHATCSVYVVR